MKSATANENGKGQEVSSNPLVLLKRKFKPHPKKPAVKIELENPNKKELQPEILITESEDQAFFTNNSAKRFETEAEKTHNEIKSILNYGEDENVNYLEDGRKSKLEFQKLQIFDISTTFVAFIGAYIAVMAYDLEFEQTDNDLLEILLWVVFATTKIAILLNILKYMQELNYLKSRNMISDKETLFSTGEIWPLLLEIFILLLQPYPFLHSIKIETYEEIDQVNYHYHVNDIFAVLLSCRIYLFVRIILNNSIYRSPRARRLSSMYGSKNDYLFACKCLMKTAPIITSLLLFGGSIFIFGYMLRICERPVNRNPVVDMNFSSYWNAMWCTILTMTTVGYGDYYAKTHFGRLISFFCCIWGVFVVSLMVVTLNNVLSMTSAEEKALAVLQRLELRKKLEKEAAFVLTNMAKVGLNNKKKPSEETEKKMRRYFGDIKHHLGEFRQTYRQIKTTDDGSNISEEMTRQFEMMRDEIKEVKAQNQDLNNVVAQLTGFLQSKFDEGKNSTPNQEGREGSIHNKTKKFSEDENHIKEESRN